MISYENWILRTSPSDEFITDAEPGDILSIAWQGERKTGRLVEIIDNGDRFAEEYVVELEVDMDDRETETGRTCTTESVTCTTELVTCYIIDIYGKRK
jgi:hypothetical protein